MAKLITEDIKTGDMVDLENNGVLLGSDIFGDMKFEHSSGEGEPNVHLTVLYEPNNRGLYAVATTTPLIGPVKVSIGDSDSSSASAGLNGFPVASGTCDLDKNGNLNNITNIKLALTGWYSLFSSQKSSG